MTTTREDREVAVACEYGSDWRSWMSDKRTVQIESYIEGNSGRFSRDYAAERIAAHREASTQALRALLERIVAADDTCPEGMAWSVEEVERVSGVIAEARDALRSAPSPSPAQGGAAVPAVFGIGDVVRGPWGADEGSVARVLDDGRLRVDIVDYVCFARPCDLVLIRKGGDNG